MPRHLDCLLAEGIGDGALVAPDFAKDNRDRVPQYVKREAWTYCADLFELNPNLSPRGSVTAKRPWLSV